MSYENPWFYEGKVFESDYIQDHFGLFIVLTVWRITEVTVEGNTFGAFERRKVLPEEASQSRTGKNIMDPVRN